MIKIKNRVLISTYLDPEQKEALDELNAMTQVPTAARFREAVNDLLIKYNKTLKGFAYKPTFPKRRKR